MIVLVAIDSPTCRNLENPRPAYIPHPLNQNPTPERFRSGLWSDLVNSTFLTPQGTLQPSSSSVFMTRWTEVAFPSILAPRMRSIGNESGHVFPCSR